MYTVAPTFQQIIHENSSKDKKKTDMRINYHVMRIGQINLERKKRDTDNSPTNIYTTGHSTKSLQNRVSEYCIGHRNGGNTSSFMIC